MAVPSLNMNATNTLIDVAFVTFSVVQFGILGKDAISVREMAKFAPRQFAVRKTMKINLWKKF